MEIGYMGFKAYPSTRIIIDKPKGSMTIQFIMIRKGKIHDAVEFPLRKPLAEILSVLDGMLYMSEHHGK